MADTDDMIQIDQVSLRKYISEFKDNFIFQCIAS